MKVPEPRKLPSGKYNLRVMLDGKSYSITRNTAKECKTEAALMKAEYKAEKRFISENNPTLKDAIDKYISDKERVLSVSTIRGYRGIQRNRFQKYMDAPIASINWQKAVNDECKEVSAKSVYNAYGFISSVLRSNGVIAPKVTMPQKINTEHEWLTPEQIPIFLQAVKGRREEFPALLALHGLRRSEIYALTADSFKDDTIHVRGAVVFNAQETLVKKKENKNTSSRRDVPILIPRLKELLAANPKFFEVPITYLTKSINNTCKDADLPQIGTHGLRHSFASLCYHAGLSERQTMMLGGWSDTATMRKIYTHISTKDMDEASKKLQQFFNF